jgi:hypothetical protein
LGDDGMARASSSGGSASGLSAIGACVLVVVGR